MGVSPTDKRNDTFAMICATIALIIVVVLFAVFMPPGLLFMS